MNYIKVHSIAILCVMLNVLSVYSQVRIVCDDITDNGFASAYTEHNFYIADADDISDCKWQYRLPLKSGGREIIKLAQDGMSCTVPALELDNMDKYVIDNNNNISCTVFFTGKKASTEVFLMYDMDLSLRPIILDADIVSIVNNSGYSSYDAHFEVSYLGANKVLVSVEEEYGTSLKSQNLYGAGYATGVADHITAPYMAWIYFLVTNDYGRATYTIELYPYGNSWDKTASIDEMVVDNGIDFDKIIVYSISGTRIAECNSIDEVKSLNTRGLYILEYRKNGSIAGKDKIVLH